MRTKTCAVRRWPQTTLPESFAFFTSEPVRAPCGLRGLAAASVAAALSRAATRSWTATSAWTTATSSRTSTTSGWPSAMPRARRSAQLRALRHRVAARRLVVHCIPQALTLHRFSVSPAARSNDRSHGGEQRWCAQERAEVRTGVSMVERGMVCLLPAPSGARPQFLCGQGAGGAPRPGESDRIVAPRCQRAKPVGSLLADFHFGPAAGPRAATSAAAAPSPAAPAPGRCRGSCPSAADPTIGKPRIRRGSPPPAPFTGFCVGWRLVDFAQDLSSCSASCQLLLGGETRQPLGIRPA